MPSSLLVVDASAVIELLKRTAAGEQVAAALVDHSASAPHLLDVELLSWLMRVRRAREIDDEEAGRHLADIPALPIARVVHTTVLDEAYSLRDNLSAYDALYAALAWRLDCGLLTADRGMARGAQTHGIAVTLLP